MGKFFKIMLAMFVFVSFVLPLSNADFDFEVPAFSESEIADTQADAYENIVNSNIKSVLENGGYLSCVVQTAIRCKNDEIEIISLDVGIVDEYDKDEVRHYISDSTGFNAEVYYIGE